MLYLNILNRGLNLWKSLRYWWINISFIWVISTFSSGSFFYCRGTLFSNSVVQHGQYVIRIYDAGFSAVKLKFPTDYMRIIAENKNCLENSKFFLGSALSNYSLTKMVGNMGLKVIIIWGPHRNIYIYLIYFLGAFDSPRNIKT